MLLINFASSKGETEPNAKITGGSLRVCCGALWRVMMRMVRRLCRWMAMTVREGCWERVECWSGDCGATGSGVGKHSRGRWKDWGCRK